MFTLEKIQEAHRQFTGPDFPRLIQAFAAMGMASNRVDLASATVTYTHKDGKSISSPGLGAGRIAPTADSANFATILRAHQRGETDFPTFCQQAAENGVAGWVTDITAFTCTYYDAGRRDVLTEKIPG